jgi:hypothetical protein
MDADDPITLTDACRIFSESKFTVSTLRAEASRGRLSIFRIGRRDYTTRRLMHDMVRRCHDDDPRRVSTLTNVSNGLSETEITSAALAALNQTAQALRKDSRDTSAKSISQGEATRR